MMHITLMMIIMGYSTDITKNITYESARKLSASGQKVARVVPRNTILVTCIASIGKNTMLANAEVLISRLTD